MKKQLLTARFYSAFVLMAAMALVCPVHSQHSPLIGKTNIHAFLEEVPGLPTTIEEAARRTYGPNLMQPDPHALDRYYQPVVDRVEAALKQYQTVYGGKMQAFGESGGMEAVRRQSEAQVNANPIVRDMGGYQKVSQMTPQQAEAAARQAAANYAADPFAANGIQSAGMTELYRKVVSDPAYAARFQKMSDKEKEAELRRFMAGDQVQAKTPQQMEQEHRRFESQMQERDKVRDAMTINQELGGIRMQIHEARSAFDEELAAIGALPGNHRELGNRFEEAYAAIPEISMDEAGRQKDPVREKKLRREFATLHRNTAIANLRRYQALLADLKSQYKQAVSRYQDFISRYGGNLNGSMTDLFSGTNTEMTVAEFEMQLIGLAGDLAQQSRQLTEETAQWEMRFVAEK